MLTSYKEYYGIFNKWRDYDFLTSLFSIIGLIIAMMKYEYRLTIYTKPLDPKKEPDPMKLPQYHDQIHIIGHYIVLSTTLFAMVCLNIKHYYRRKWTNRYSSCSGQDCTDNTNNIAIMYDEIINENERHSYNKFFTMNYLGEMLILMLVPIPFVDKYVEMTCRGNIKVVYLMSDFLFACMWLRLYFLIQTIFNFSIYRDPLSKKLCQAYGFKGGIFYAIKCNLLLSPINTCLGLFMVTIFTAAYVIRIFEIPYYRMTSDPVFDSYYQSIWFTVITFTTIGYGDISPLTPPG